MQAVATNAGFDDIRRGYTYKISFAAIKRDVHIEHKIVSTLTIYHGKR